MFGKILSKLVSSVLDIAQNSGLDRKVTVMATVLVVADDRLCKLCRSYAGKSYTIKHNLSPQEALQQMQWLQEGVRSGSVHRTQPTLPKYHNNCRCDVQLETK